MSDKGTAFVLVCTYPTSPIGDTCGLGIDTPIWEVAYRPDGTDSPIAPKLPRCGAHVISTVAFLVTAESGKTILESVSLAQGTIRAGRPS